MKDSVHLKADMMTKINDLVIPGQIVVFGSTYMAGFPLYELINKCTFENAIYNRSIRGLTINEALEIVKGCVLDICPDKIFISLGEEDEKDPDAINNYARLISEIRFNLPNAALYLIGLPYNGVYADSFNKAIMNICDGKTVKYIEFINKKISDSALYKARFKQLSCFFRTSPLNMCDAFGIAYF